VKHSSFKLPINSLSYKAYQGWHISNKLFLTNMVFQVVLN